MNGMQYIPDHGSHGVGAGLTLGSCTPWGQNIMQQKETRSLFDGEHTGISIPTELAVPTARIYETDLTKTLLRMTL